MSSRNHRLYTFFYKRIIFMRFCAHFLLFAIKMRVKEVVFVSMFHDFQTLHVKQVYLLVKDLDRAIYFYRDILGFKITTKEEHSCWFGTDKQALIHVEEDHHADTSLITLGLYHFALLLPNRSDLARMILRLKEMRYPVSGASDHGVSEAIYLDDPDGNGIEIYVDKDSLLWPKKDGEINMYTHPLNIENVLSSMDTYVFNGIHPDTIIGHIHFYVDSIKEVEIFYTNVLGFKKVFLYKNSALFISDRLYHHHIGLNTWQKGAPLRGHRHVGLKAYTLYIPKQYYLSFIHRLSDHRIPLLTESGQSYILDPLNQKIYISTK